MSILNHRFYESCSDARQLLFMLHGWLKTQYNSDDSRALKDQEFVMEGKLAIRKICC